MSCERLGAPVDCSVDTYGNPSHPGRLFSPVAQRPFLPRLLLAAAAALSCATCAGPAQRPLRVGLLVWPGFEPAYLARQLGYLDSTQVALVDYVSASDLMRALRNDRVDAIAMTLASGIQLSADDPETRAVMVLDVSNGGDAVLGIRDVKSVADLRGRRVAVSPSGGSSFLIARALSKAGMTLDDIQRVPMDEASLESSLMSGAVDAVMTYEPQKSQLVERGAVELFSSREIPGEVADVLIVRGAVLRTRMPALRAFADAWFRARDTMLAMPDSAASRLASRERVSDLVFRRMLQGMHFPDRAENVRLLSDTSAGLLHGARLFVDVMRRDGLLTKAPDPHTLLEAGVVAPR